MASTSFTLGQHFDEYIKSEVKNGQYSSASEVVRAALRKMEENSTQLAELRSHLAIGEAEADRGEFVGLDVAEIITKQFRSTNLPAH